MKIRYDAFSPADGGERLIEGEEFELPDDAGQAAVLGALEHAVERKAAVDSGSQVRVIAWRDDETEAFVSHTWDHG